jgi:hypothetical protein
MSKSDRNTGKPWTPQQVAELGKLASQNTPTRVIGLKLAVPKVRCSPRHRNRASA